MKTILDTHFTATDFMLMFGFSRTALFPSVRDHTPSDTAKLSSTVSSPGHRSADNLLELRRTYFPNIEKCFDPFASPMLFFRTPSCDVPDRGRKLFPHGPSIPEDLSAVTSGETLEKKRRSHRKYPPAHLELRIPTMRVDVDEGSALKGQCSEFIELLHKGASRLDGEATNEDLRDVNLKFTLLERSGFNLWDRKNLFEIGQWFNDQLRS